MIVTPHKNKPPINPRSPDTVEFHKIIVEKWNAGLSATDIGKLVGRNRNQVIGIVNRAKLRGEYVVAKNPGMAAAKARSRVRKNPKARVLQKITLPVMPKAEIQICTLIPEPEPTLDLTAAAPIGIMALSETTCRYIVAGPDFVDTLYCGMLVERGAYCKAHATLCYEPPRDRAKQLGRADVNHRMWR